MGLLTHEGPDEPGSWGRLSEGWIQFHDERAHDMYVFANCVETIPYGSYVIMTSVSRSGAEIYLRVHPEYIEKLKVDFAAAGEPTKEQSMDARNRNGQLLPNGLRKRAPRWW